MSRIAYRARTWIACLTLVWLGVPFALAQSAAEEVPAYVEPQQIAALDAVVSVLVPDPASATPNDFIELSRSLAEPCDQVRWLLVKARLLDGQPGTRANAAQLAAAALKRAQALADLGLLSDCGEVAPLLREIAERPESPESVTDPAALKTLLAKAEADPKRLRQLQDLPAYAKFVLLSRGAPAAQLLARLPAWDMPRVVLERLAEKAELPPAWELLDLQQRLTAARVAWVRDEATEFADPAQRQAAEASFQVAAALLDRALGLDRQDRAGLTRPIPYEDSREAWLKVADRFHKEALRTWGTLARLLAAATGSGVDSESTAAAQGLWQAVRAVNPGVWAALDDSANGWLVRLQAGERLVQRKTLPLSADFRAGERSQRRSYEDKVRSLLTAGSPNSDELFRNIQWAKAADLGASIAPLTIDGLLQEFGTVQWVYLFVELLELHAAEPGQVSEFCGVAVYRKLYREPIAGVKYEDEYLSKVIGPQSSPMAVISAALAAPGPPLQEGTRIQKDARIIIALDGPPPPEWVKFEQDTLLAPLESGWTLKPSWVVYMPSAAALKSEQWSLDQTLRVWYRAAARTWNGRLAVVASASGLALRGAGPPLEQRRDMIVYAVTLGDTAAFAENRLKELLAAKRRSALATLPLWVHN